MRRVIHVLLVLSVCAAGTAILPGPAAAQRALTLDECVGMAMELNPVVARADRQLLQNEIQRRQAASALLPTVSLSGAFSRYTSVSPQRLLNPVTNQIVEGSSTANTSMSYYSGLSVSQPLFNRSTTAVYTQALAAEENARAGRNLQSQQVVLQVHQAYYGLLRAIRNLEVAGTDVDYNTELLRQVRTMHSLGNRARVDVLRQESALAQAQQRLIAAENSVEKARAELNYLMGLSPTEPLEIIDDLDYEPQQVSFEASLDAALQEHPSIRQAVLGITSAEAGIQAATAPRYPSMNLSGNYSWRGDSYHNFNDAFSKDYTWSVGVNVYVPVFNGLRTRFDIQRARLDLSGARVEMEATKRDVTREVHRAVLDLQEADQVLQTANRAVELAREAQRLAEERYSLGAGTLLEVNASQLDLINAQYQSVQALFNLKVATASLDFAMGRL